MPITKRKSKTVRQILDRDCLNLWSLCVRTKQKTCRYCNSSHNLQAHHIVQRTYKLSRYRPDNGLTLCKGCHFVEKMDPERFRNMIISIIGEEDYLRRQRTYRVQYKWSISELREIRKDLRQQLKALESDWGAI
jgi:hypothetical protein